MIFISYLLKIICSEDENKEKTLVILSPPKKPQDFLINDVETSKQSCGKENKFGSIPHVLEINCKDIKYSNINIETLKYQIKTLGELFHKYGMVP